MITFLICILAAVLYIKLGIMAFKFTWGIIKVLFSLVFWPILLVGFLAGGLVYAAVIVLAIVGLFTVIGSLATS